MSHRDIFQARQSARRKAVCFHLNVIIMSVNDKGSLNDAERFPGIKDAGTEKGKSKIFIYIYLKQKR